MTEITKPLDDKWIYEEPGRSMKFQKWLDSLESYSVRRTRIQVDGKRPRQNMNRPK